MYKKLKELNLDWSKSYTKEELLEIAEQLDPEEEDRKILEAGIKAVYENR